MNYIELYKVCKDYASFVEQNFKQVNALTEIITSADSEDCIEIAIKHPDFDFEKDSDLIPLLLRKEDAIISPIRKGVADSIYNSIDEKRELINKTIEEAKRIAEKVAPDWVDETLEDITDIKVTVSQSEMKKDLPQDILDLYFGD